MKRERLSGSQQGRVGGEEETKRKPLKEKEAAAEQVFKEAVGDG